MKMKSIKILPELLISFITFLSFILVEKGLLLVPFFLGTSPSAVTLCVEDIFVVY